MMRGMFAAISGLAVHQTMLDVTANNIANVNTIGYKSERTSFEDALSQLQKGAASSASSPTRPSSALPARATCTRGPGTSPPTPTATW
jgi:flagellar hook protein FlgE